MNLDGQDVHAAHQPGRGNFDRRQAADAEADAAFDPGRILRCCCIHARRRAVGLEECLGRVILREAVQGRVRGQVAARQLLAIQVDRDAPAVGQGQGQIPHRGRVVHLKPGA